MTNAGLYDEAESQGKSSSFRSVSLTIQIMLLFNLFLAPCRYFRDLPDVDIIF